MKAARPIVSALIFLAVGSSASAQLTVDARGPIHERSRRAESGSGDSIGRKLPLKVDVEINGADPHDTGATLICFVITNTGKDKLTVPISPNPGDLEPADPGAGYTLSRLSFYMTSDKDRRAVLSAETSLYGAQTFPETLLTMAPGESLRVPARVRLFPDKSGAPVFTAHVSFNTDKIKITGGRTVLHSQEIGSATSAEYTAQDLTGAVLKK